MTYQFENVKLLVIEDMAPMLSVLESLLQIFGFKSIHTAENAEDGYALFREHNHDLILTDWLMEPVDGLELTRKIRNDEDSPNKFVPVIIMTGYCDRARVEVARDSGITEFLMKPFSARDLYARIVQVIEKPRQFVDNGAFFGPDRRRRKGGGFGGGERRRNPNDKNKGHWPEDAGIDLILADLAEEAKKL